MSGSLSTIILQPIIKGTINSLYKPKGFVDIYSKATSKKPKTTLMRQSAFVADGGHNVFNSKRSVFESAKHCLKSVTVWTKTTIGLSFTQKATRSRE